MFIFLLQKTCRFHPKPRYCKISKRDGTHISVIFQSVNGHFWFAYYLILAYSLLKILLLICTPSTLSVEGVLPSLRISVSSHGKNLKLTPVIPLDKRSWLMTSSLLPHDTCAFYRPETKRKPDTLFQVVWLLLTSHFLRYIGMTKEYHTWRQHDYHMTWVQFTGQRQNEEQI